MSSESSTKRVKILGAVLATTALVVVGVVMLGQTSSQMNPLERSAAIARATKYENDGVSLANLPSESEVHVPDGWQVESDKAVAGAEEEELDQEGHSAEDEEVADDDDVDSPLDVEEDENGEKYVAEMDEDVIVTEDGQEQQDGDAVTAVAADRRYPRCFKNLRKCGYKKACVRKCKKYCPLKAKKVCFAKKFCKCFCKYYKNIKRARKCIYYKKITCTKALTYKCKKGCTKLCKRIPRCYCCARKHVRRACRKLCKRISYKTKCGKCRCYRIKCYKYCKFLCRKYKKY